MFRIRHAQTQTVLKRADKHDISTGKILNYK
jgi:hypothetical protein